MLNYLTQYAVVFLMPFYLDNFLQMPPSTAGLVMTSFPLVMLLTSPISGMLSDRIGSRTLTSAGMGIIATGVLILSLPPQITSLISIVSGLGLVGLGTGLFLSPNNNAIMSSIPKNQTGVGSGMLATMRNVGQVLGVAISGAVFSNRLAAYSAQLQLSNHNPQAVYGQSFSWAIRDAFRKAFSVGFIEDDSIWLDMIKDRNLTSHKYDEKTSYEIYTHIFVNLHIWCYSEKNG